MHESIEKVIWRSKFQKSEPFKLRIINEHYIKGNWLQYYFEDDEMLNQQFFEKIYYEFNVAGEKDKSSKSYIVKEK